MYIVVYIYMRREILSGTYTLQSRDSGSCPACVLQAASVHVSVQGFLVVSGLGALSLVTGALALPWNANVF